MDHSQHHDEHHNHHLDMMSTEEPHHNHSGGSHMHSMAFHFGLSETILFDSWQVSTAVGMVSSVLGIFFAAIIYEGLKYFREFLFWKNYNAMRYTNVNGVTAAAERKRSDEGTVTTRPTLFNKHHAFQTGLHMLQMIISYMLMLIFMTFNVWLCLGVILGSTVGYFLFGWKKALFVDITEHCH